MKIGDLVRVVSVPPDLRDDSELNTSSLFSLCLGRAFRIIALDSGLIELHVGGVIGQEPWGHSIFIKPQHVELAKISD